MITAWHHLQIVEQIPPHLLQKMFAEVHLDKMTAKTCRPVLEQFARPKHRPLVRLLQLLPRTFHPAVVASNCRGAADADAITINRMPHCHKAPSVYDDPSSARYASITFQLLAGAAPLAGGSLDDAWCDDGTERIKSAAADLRCGATKLAPLLESTGAEGESGPGTLHSFNSRN